MGCDRTDKRAASAGVLPFLFADCSKSPQRNATIGMYNKGAVRERQTGRPPNLRLSLRSHAGYLLRVPLLQAGHSRSLKKTVPRQCEAIAVARTDYQIPPDSRKCSGVSIPQAVSLSPPFHDTACILFLAQKVPGALPFGGVHPVLLYVRFFAGCFQQPVGKEGGSSPQRKPQHHPAQNVGGEVDVEVQPGKGDEGGKDQRCRSWFG